MRQFFLLLLQLGIAGQLWAGTGSLHVPATGSSGDPITIPPGKSIVWAGIDYSSVRIVRPTDAGDLEAILPEMALQWNHLFVRECLKDLAQNLHKTVESDTQWVDARNQLTSSKQIILSPKPEDSIESTHITRADIAGLVRSCQLTQTNGLGLLLVADRLVRPSSMGAVYVVFFDLGSREIVQMGRQVHMANGVGFRNYWFGVIKRTVAQLK